MTYEEAIEILKANYPDVCYSLLREAVDKAIEALEKQVSTSDMEKVRYGLWIDTTKYCGEFTCSICKETCVTNKYNYCPHCGTKMDGKNSVRKVDCSITEEEYNKGLNDLRDGARKVVKQLLIDDFIKNNCHNCGTQRCGGPNTEWFEGCALKDELKKEE